MATINYSGGDFNKALRQASVNGDDLLIKAGNYPRLSASQINKPVNVWYEEVVVGDELTHTIRQILDGDLSLDIEMVKQRAALQINDSTALVTIQPAYRGAQIIYRNMGRGVSGYNTTGGIRHVGGLFYNLLGRAFGGTADNMTLEKAKVRDCVLENYNHRRGRKFNEGGGWSAAVASWGMSGRAAKNFKVVDCQFGDNIWGETIGCFDVDGFVVESNTFYNSSHTVIIYGSSGSNVQVLNNFIHIDNATCPMRDEWRPSGGNMRLPHGVAIGKEGGDNFHQVHNWDVRHNTIIGGETGVNIGWVEHPFKFHAEIHDNFIYGQVDGSVVAKQWLGLIDGTGHATNNVIGKRERLEVGEWSAENNQVLSVHSAVPDTKTIQIVVSSDLSGLKWEAGEA